MLRGAIPFTGLLTHCYDFLVSPSADIFIHNQNFNEETATPVTIFCVHGTADRAGAFFRLADALLPTLSDDIRGIYLCSFVGRMDGLSIESFAKQLRGKIDRFGDKAVILMGHSRGSLVCAMYAETMAEADGIHVDTVVAISGPFKGTRKAVKLLAWFSRSVEQMREDSDFLPVLREKVIASNVRYLFVGAARDLIVQGDSWHPYPEALPNGHFLKSQEDAHLSITASELLANWLKEMLQNNFRRQFDGVVVQSLK